MKVLVATGKRGGYGAMKPLLRLLADDADIDLAIYATDQHTSLLFGQTISEIETEFKVKYSHDMGQQSSSQCHRTKALASCLDNVASVLSDFHPDVAILYGDRSEILTIGLACTIMNIPIAHIQGGDVSGSVDENTRHALTKLSKYHFPSNEKSAARLMQLGEPRESIKVVGDCHIDEIIAGNYLTKKDVIRKLALKEESLKIIVLQHSETTDPDSALNQMLETLHAVDSFDAEIIVIHPCSDQGYGGILSAIDQCCVSSKYRVFKNLDAGVFWGLQKIAHVLVGNSSAGIVEAACFGLPVVNVGRRQSGRLCSENVIHVAHEQNAIQEAIHASLFDEMTMKRARNCSNLYGDGTACKQIYAHLKGIDAARLHAPKLFVELDHA